MLQPLCQIEQQYFARLQCAHLDSIRVEDAWNIDKSYDKQETDITAVTSIKTLESGPLREIVRITRQWGKSTFIQDLTLYAGIARLDVVNDIDWPCYSWTGITSSTSTIPWATTSAIAC